MKQKTFHAQGFNVTTHLLINPPLNLNAKAIEERNAIISEYKNQTDIFANFIGKVFDDNIAKQIKCFRQKNSCILSDNAVCAPN